jgi:hypothetical protein
VTVKRLPAAELDAVFGLLANELRIEIIRTLWEQQEEPLSFTDLQSLVDVRDSGKFNYHLNVLVPAFVERSEDGYALTHAGQHVVGAAVSGRFTEADEITVDDVPAGECMFCGGHLSARYEGGDVTVDCDDCEDLVTRMPIPPNTVSGLDPEDLPAVFSRHLLTLTNRLSRGFCKLCQGRVDSSLTALSSSESVTFRPSLDVRFDCRACGDRTHLNVGGVVMDHPAVTSFLYDHGIDLRRSYVWELTSLLDPEATVASEDPLRLRLVVRLDGDELELTLDETATVVDHTRG